MAAAAKKAAPKVSPPAPQAPAAATPLAPKVAPVLNLDRQRDPKGVPSDLTVSPDGRAYETMQYTLPIGHRFEDLLTPSYWSSAAYKMKSITGVGTYAGSIIEVRARDLSFYGRLFVRDVSDRALVVEVLERHEIGLQELKSDKFEARWDDSQKGYDIIRKSDRAIVGYAKDFKTKDAVQSWIDKTMDI